MAEAEQNKKINLPNLLLVSGNGRNSGKTYFACQVIKELSENMEVVAVKISPHFHHQEGAKVVVEEKDFIIIDEDRIIDKDSSLMLQAGASKVWFVMVKRGKIDRLLPLLIEIIGENAIICESAGLHKLVNPGAFVFIKRTGEQIVKNEHIEGHPVIVENNGNSFSLELSNITFTNNQFSII